MSDELNYEQILLAFQQQCERCLKNGDTFLNITVNSEELAQALYEFREKLAAHFTEQGRQGEAIVTELFPRTTPAITVIPEQPQAVTWQTLAMAEYESIHALNLRLMGFFSKEMGPLLGLPMVAVTAQDGSKHEIVPLLYDYGMFKQALMNFLVSTYCGAVLQNALQDQNDRRIQVATVPNEALRILSR